MSSINIFVWRDDQIHAQNFTTTSDNIETIIRNTNDKATQLGTDDVKLLDSGSPKNLPINLQNTFEQYEIA